MQHTIANMVKRVMHIVREVAKANEIPLPAGDEYQLVGDQKEIAPIESLYEILKGTPKKVGQTEIKGAGGEESRMELLKKKLEEQRNSHKQEILQQIDEVANELEFMRQAILEQAKEYILPNDVILTYDLSVTLIEFFAVHPVLYFRRKLRRTESSKY